MQNHLISIVLPVYNGQEFLKQAIKSVLNQTYGNFELIIVNDCSTDNSLVIIETFAKKDKRIIVINNKTNKNLPTSLNIGHKVASGKYITWTSDDNILKPNFLDYLLNSIIEKQVDIVYSNYDVIYGSNVLKRSHTTGPTGHLLFGNKIGASFLYKKEVFNYLQGYDESLFLLEDFDFWLRASLNFSFHHLDENLYSYRLHLGSLTSKIESNLITNTKYKEALFKMLKKIADKYHWNKITHEFLMDNLLNNEINIFEYLKNKRVIENDILVYSSEKFNKKDILYGIKLIMRNQLVSKNNNIKTLLMILKEDRSLLFDQKFSKKTTFQYVLKSIF